MIPLLLFLVLGILQGILEWLPVSSEGQILFVGTLFGVDDTILLLSVAFWLHFGTMIAVLVYYRSEWLQILNLRNEEMAKVRRFLIITTIGTAMTGLPIKVVLLDIVSAESFSIAIMVILGVALVATGLLLKYQKLENMNEGTLDDISDLKSLGIGMAQGLSIIPGVSRSGTTVTALFLAKVNSEESFRGSFFMSVPAVGGAIALDLLDYIRGESDTIIAVNPLGVILGIILAAIVGYLTISFLLKFAKEVDFSNIVLIIALLVFLYIFLVI